MLLILLLTSLAYSDHRGVIRGRVQDREGKPIPEVRVSVAGERGEKGEIRQETVSRPDGSFEFQQVPFGTYTVTGEAKNYLLLNPVTIRVSRKEPEETVLLIMELLAPPVMEPIAPPVEPAPPKQELLEGGRVEPARETVIRSGDNLAMITIPRGALPQQTQIRVRVISTDNLRIVQKGIIPPPTIYEFDGGNARFTRPVVIQLPIPVDLARRYREANLAVYTSSSPTGPWEQVGGTVDRGGTFASVEVAHLSFFGVFAIKLTPPEIKLLIPPAELHTIFDRMTFSGVAEPGSRLEINGQIVPVNPSSGDFRGDISLIQGVNDLSIKATDPANNTTVLTQRVTVERIASPSEKSENVVYKRIETAQGGDVQSSDRNLSVSFPPQSLPKDTVITVTQFSQDENVNAYLGTRPEIPADMVLLSAIYDLMPSGSFFSGSATLLIKYKQPSDVKVSPESISIYYWNPNEKWWVKESSSVNHEKLYAEAKVTHFSLFTVLGKRGEMTHHDDVIALCQTGGVRR